MPRRVICIPMRKHPVRTFLSLLTALLAPYLGGISETAIGRVSLPQAVSEAAGPAWSASVSPALSAERRE